MQTYRCQAWWTIINGVDHEIEAETEQHALLEFKRRMRDEDGFFDSQRSYDDSDGDTNIEIKDEDGTTVAHENGREEQQLEDAADLKTAVAQYQKLHDGLSDMIEEGRLTTADIPDDYRWLVDTLGKCCDVSAKAEGAGA